MQWLVRFGRVVCIAITIALIVWCVDGVAALIRGVGPSATSRELSTAPTLIPSMNELFVQISGGNGSWLLHGLPWEVRVSRGSANGRIVPELDTDVTGFVSDAGPSEAEKLLLELAHQLGRKGTVSDQYVWFRLNEADFDCRLDVSTRNGRERLARIWLAVPFNEGSLMLSAVPGASKVSESGAKQEILPAPAGSAILCSHLDAMGTANLQIISTKATCADLAEHWRTHGWSVEVEDAEGAALNELVCRRERAAVRACAWRDFGRNEQYVLVIRVTQ